MKPTCVYCGRNPATSVDHVPPKVCFPKPRPLNTITVPCCEECNNSFSADDEVFASNLSLRVGIETEATQKLHEKNRRIFAKNRRIARSFVERLEFGLVKKDGVTIGAVPMFGWRDETHDRVIARIVRGLYFHKLGQILPQECPVRASWQPQYEGELLELWRQWDGEDIGKEGQFRYRYAYALENPMFSVWMLIFYDRHFAGGTTGAREK